MACKLRKKRSAVLLVLWLQSVRRGSKVGSHLVIIILKFGRACWWTCYWRCGRALRGMCTHGGLHQGSCCWIRPFTFIQTSLRFLTLQTAAATSRCQVLRFIQLKPSLLGLCKLWTRTLVSWSSHVMFWWSWFFFLRPWGSLWPSGAGRRAWQLLLCVCGRWGLRGLAAKQREARAKQGAGSWANHADSVKTSGVTSRGQDYRGVCLEASLSRWFIRLFSAFILLSSARGWEEYPDWFSPGT